MLRACTDELSRAVQGQGAQNPLGEDLRTLIERRKKCQLVEHTSVPPERCARTKIRATTVAPAYVEHVP